MRACVRACVACKMNFPLSGDQAVVIQRGTMSRCQGLSHFVTEVFLDFDKRDRLADCSIHEFIKRGGRSVGWFSIEILFYLLLEDILVYDNRYAFVYRDIVLNLRICREVKVGLKIISAKGCLVAWISGMNSHIRMQ